MSKEKGMIQYVDQRRIVLPCPFCGKTPTFIYQPSATNHDWTFQTGCHNAECPVDCLIETYGQKEDWEAVMDHHLARWNTRQNATADLPATVALQINQRRPRRWMTRLVSLLNFMSRYGYNSDHRQGERDFERNGRYGYDESRYLGYDRESRDYQDGFDEARRADERRREEREAEEAAERRAEYLAEERRREMQREEDERYEQALFENEQAEAKSEANAQEHTTPRNEA